MIIIIKRLLRDYLNEKHDINNYVNKKKLISFKNKILNIIKCKYKDVYIKMY